MNDEIFIIDNMGISVLDVVNYLTKKKYISSKRSLAASKFEELCDEISDEEKLHFLIELGYSKENIEFYLSNDDLKPEVDYLIYLILTKTEIALFFSTEYVGQML